MSNLPENAGEQPDQLTHLGEHGNIHMVDVTEPPATEHGA